MKFLLIFPISTVTIEAATSTKVNAAAACKS